MVGKLHKISFKMDMMENSRNGKLEMTLEKALCRIHMWLSHSISFWAHEIWLNNGLNGGGGGIGDDINRNLLVHEMVLLKTSKGFDGNL